MHTVQSYNVHKFIQGVGVGIFNSYSHGHQAQSQDKDEKVRKRNKQHRWLSLTDFKVHNKVN